MRLATIKKGEEDLTTLVNRLYDIKGPQAANLADNAKKMLIRMNPGLTNLRKVRDGTPILVPELPDTKSTTESWSMGLAAQQMVDDIHEALGGVRDALGASIVNEKEDAKATLAVLKKDFNNLIKDDQSLKALSSKAKDSANERVERAENLKVVHTQALQLLEKDLKDFIKGLA